MVTLYSPLLVRTRDVRRVLGDVRRGGGRLGTRGRTTSTAGVRGQAGGGLPSPAIDCDSFCDGNIRNNRNARFITSRNFSFPARCVTHGQRTALRGRTISGRRRTTHQSVLLGTGGLYLSLVLLGRRGALVSVHVGGTSRLRTLCRGHLAANSTGVLRIGGVGVRHVGIRARITRGDTTRHATLRSLLTVGNGVPLRFTRAACPTVRRVGSCGIVESRIVTSSLSLRTTTTVTHTTRGRISMSHRK